MLTDAVADAAGRGDEGALRVVYEVLAPPVFGYLRSRGVDDPEGLTQEVFLALLPRLARLHGGSRGLRTLAFSIAHARAVDEARRRATRPVSVPLDVEVHGGWAASAEEQALANTGETDAFEVLAGLSEDHRTVIALRVIAQLSLEETARVLGRSVGAVKQLQRRGLLAMRGELLARERVTQAAALR